MIAPIEKLKEWFKTGAKPTQEQFHALIDSYVHKEEDMDYLFGKLQGSTYMGNAMPGDVPPVTTQKIFYTATSAGTYTNFAGAVLDEGETAILVYDKAWSKVTLSILAQELGDSKEVAVSQKGITTALKVTDDKIRKVLKTGYEIVSSENIAYSSYATVLTDVDKGCPFSIKILNATESDGLYIQAFRPDGVLIRLGNLVEVGKEYIYRGSTAYTKVIVSNYNTSQSVLNIDVQIGYFSYASINEQAKLIDANSTEIQDVKKISGYEITLYSNNGRVNILDNIIPKGTLIIPSSPIWIYDSNFNDSRERLVQSDEFYVTEFDVVGIITDGASVNISVYGTSPLNNTFVNDYKKYINYVGTSEIFDYSVEKDTTFFKKPLLKGTTITFELIPEEEGYNKVMVYYRDNVSNDRLVDFRYEGNKKTVTLKEDISFLALYIVEFKPFSIKMDVHTKIPIYGNNIVNESISENHLTEELKNKINSLTPNSEIKFTSFKNNGITNTNEYLTLPEQHLGKNYTFVCRCNNLIESICFGVGYVNSTQYMNRTYGSMWVEITTSEIKQYRYYNADYQLINTTPLSITINSSTIISMEALVDKTLLKVYNNIGDVHTQNLQVGYGAPFVYNGGQNSLDLELSFFPKDLLSNIWVFGDSYFNFTVDYRWTYYFAQDNNINWLSNNQPGLSPSTAYNDLINLLALNHTPKYLVWCLGMNGDTQESTDSNGNYVINEYQKTYIDNIVALCRQKNIEIVLATIPTVPQRQKTGFNGYVKSLGVRYIDFAKAVGATSEGSWHEGLLSGDGVHPTQKGAVVLASQVMIDFPELTTSIY